MSKRLQVILQDSEYRDIKRAARSKQLSIAEWVRQAIEGARRRESASAAAKKLEVIRAAVRHEFPFGDMDAMLTEIDRGHGTTVWLP